MDHYDAVFSPDEGKAEMITITKGEYVRLLRADTILEVLEAYGVEDWTGYDIAIQAIDNV